MMRIGLILLCMLFGALAHAAPIDNKDGFWSEWNEATFERAAREKKFVVLSLQAWWCRWCFIMNRETWSDPGVRKILKDNFIPVHVDQDSRPDISQRYEDFGWPATIILNADGTEIVKLRGYYSPQYFIPILEETVRDPSPVVYTNRGGGERPRTLATSLSDSQRKSILNFIDNEAWNEEFGGWSRSKFVDGPTLGWALRRAKQGDAVQASRIERTLKGMLSMIDRDYGAMGQENRNLDWSDPVRTYPMFAQEAGLTAYSQAAMLFSDPAYRVAADRIYAFLKNTMAATDGGFYASLGLGEGVPGIDRKRYTRESAQAISALLAYHDATGVAEARDLAVKAARWILANRAHPEGGFRHAEIDIAGPYLSDNVEVAKAMLALHRSTGGREWLIYARTAADFIAANFVDQATGGFMSAVAASSAKGLVKPTKQREDNVTAVRMFNLLSSYTGEGRYRDIAEAGMGYLTSTAVLDAYVFLPDVLLAEDELRNEPVHVTIVGAKDDPRASDLYRSALSYPALHKRAEWWDKREGPLASPDVDYPDFPDGPAAFACTKTFCSYPVTKPSEIAKQLDGLNRAIKR
jgi:uncharacterized protein